MSYFNGQRIDEPTEGEMRAYRSEMREDPAVANESIQVLISELANKSPEYIRAIFDKCIAEGSSPAIDALEFIGNLSQA